ncbi:unnamed protein product [Ilex paraguariensis]|uniref:TF-B3 domain-containing protein n=1 Tax=Ilex paraguariensis TaxID=185542 RepID=A0ABC8UC75_9AQUA
MGDECRECRKWEEDLYWNHFQSVQFIQFLSGDFYNQLAIPKKFVNNLREKLSDFVILKGPSGTAWSVGLASSGDTLLFKHGWSAFVEDHSLEEDDVLVFKYNGDSRFDVVMFARLSFCEKEGSYFVRKCEHTEVDSGCRTKRDMIMDSFEVTDDSSHDTAGYTPSKKVRKDDTWTPSPSAGQDSRASRRNRRNAKNGRKRSSSRTWVYPMQYVSKRRPVTEEEKEKALQMAKVASTKDSFLVVMRPSHVYKGFFMSIPAEWATINLRDKTQDVTLRVRENTWHVRLYQRACGCGLTSGWKNFAIENFLEEFDVCLFNPAGETNNTIVMDVSIFRVVEEVIPPTKVTSPTSRRGKPSKKF